VRRHGTVSRKPRKRSTASRRCRSTAMHRRRRPRNSFKQTDLARLTRELAEAQRHLAEALDQQAATSEILESSGVRPATYIRSSTRSRRVQLDYASRSTPSSGAGRATGYFLSPITARSRKPVPSPSHSSATRLVVDRCWTGRPSTSLIYRPGGTSFPSRARTRDVRATALSSASP
jgi:hypothetical protein